MKFKMTEVRQKLQISHTDVIPALRYLPTSSISPPHRIPVRVPHARLSNNTKF